MPTLRALLFNAAFLLWTLVLGILGFAVRLAARDRALALARLWVKGTVALLRVVGGIPVLVSGDHHLGDGRGLVIASEHRAGIDSLLWLALLPRPSYVMKQELRRLPLVGPLLEPAGMIPVDRYGGAAALRAMLRAGRAALAEGRSLVIFPEGTRADRTGAVPLAGGVVALAGKGAAPLLPVATDSGLAWGRGFLLRLGRRRAGADAIRILITAPLGLAGGADPRDAIVAAWHRADAAIADREGSWRTL